MNKYLLIESSEPFDSASGDSFCRLAGDLADGGNEVILFLVQNAVLAARSSSASAAVRAAAARGVRVVADDFSLRERGIAPARLESGVAPVGIDLVVDKLADGYKAFWH